MVYFLRGMAGVMSVVASSEYPKDRRKRKKMKKFIGIILASAMVLSLAACGSTGAAPAAQKSEKAETASASASAPAEAETNQAAADVKIGVILVGDETEGYTAAHMEGIKAAMAANGIPDANVLWKYKVEENSDCYDAAVDLYASGCRLILANSYGHQTYMDQAAAEFSDATFLSMTGDFAAVSGKPNLKNAFTKVYESRYVAGVVAGLKLQELIDAGELTADKYPNSFDKDGNIKIGYVGAFNYAEVVSGYTAFYLGIKSIVENVAMEVKYTQSWFDIDKEAATAQALVANGCVIIGQHADSTGAPAMCEKLSGEGSLCFSVGYNVDMLATAPSVALTSATNNWAIYYTYAFKAFLAGEDIAVDWADGYAADAVAITDLGPACAEGTKEKVDEVIAGIKSGDIHVFDVSTFTVEGKNIDSAMIDTSYYDWSTGSPVLVYEGPEVEAVQDGYFSESTIRSAPYFALRIDGITEDAD